MNKTIFITGTSTGFGKLTAITLAKAGFTVIAGMRGVTGKMKPLRKNWKQFRIFMLLRLMSRMTNLLPMLLSKHLRNSVK